MLMVVPPTSLSILWQLPQIVIMTAAEIMFSVTGLEFSFTQAPVSMKAVLQACWLLSVAIGNMIVVVIAELKFVGSQSSEFALFATLMLINLLIFLLLARNYKYTDIATDTDTDNRQQQQQKHLEKEFIEELIMGKDQKKHTTQREYGGDGTYGEGSYRNAAFDHDLDP